MRVDVLARDVRDELFGLKVTNKSNHTVWVKEEHTGRTHTVPPRGTWPSRAGSVKT